MARVQQRKTVQLLTSPTMSVEAIVSVRGMDLDAGPARIRIEEREPVEVVVRRNGGSERICIPKTGDRTMAIVAVPLAAFFITRAYKRLSRRSK